jgi:spore coat protein H
MTVLNAHNSVNASLTLIPAFVLPTVIALSPFAVGAATPTDTAIMSGVPTYELKISKEEWTKLQRNPGSDERHPAKFFADGKEYSVGVRYRGDWARSWPKKPLKIFFEKDKEFEGNEVLNLNSCWRDPAFVREHMAYHIYAICGAPASKTRMVRLHLNGQFHGFFVEVEQPEKAFLKRSNLKGAAVYKTTSPSQRADARDLGAETSFRAHWEKETRKGEDYRDLQTFCHELATSTNVLEFFTARVDLDKYINFLAATALVQNWDCFNKNHFLIHDASGSGKWLAIPWDLDRTLGDHWHGHFDDTDLPLRIGTSTLPGPTGWNRLYDKFFNDPTLRERFLDRLEALLEKEFTGEKLFPILDRLESEIRADVALDRKRWPNRGAGNLRQGIEDLKRYIEGRRAYLSREIKAQRRKS